MPLYRPRCRAVLAVPTKGKPAEKNLLAEQAGQWEFEVNVHRAEWIQNDHNQADELTLDLAWDQAGVDPRFLAHAVVKFWLGDANDDGELEISDRTFRFTGVAVTNERTLDESKKLVRIKFHDYTHFFIASKPYPTDGIPSFEDSFKTAWEKICDNTGYYSMDEGKLISSVQLLRDKIEFRGRADPERKLGKSVGPRFAKQGKVECGLNKSAWEVWQHCVGSAGLISYVEKEKVIVTDAVAYYTQDNPPKFVWGENILKLDEKRDTLHTGKFICLTSVNPMTGAAIEAYWPPRDQNYGRKQVKDKRTKKKPVAGGHLTPVNEYEIHAYPYGVTDIFALEECARRVWEERSRQEFTGSLTTREMSVARANAPTTFDYDPLDLRSGDVIQVALDTDYSGELTRFGSDAVRIQYLRDIYGLDYTVARLIVENMSGLGKLPPNFMVRKVHATLEFTESGSFDIHLEFCNRIQEEGSALSQLSDASAVTSSTENKASA